MEIRPHVLDAREGQALWFLGTLTLVKATSEQTGGAFGLLEQEIPAGFASPWHLHHREDETFYVLEGQMTFLCGDQVSRVAAGAYLFLPRGIPHGFRVDGVAPGRLLVLVTPGGFERFIVEASEPATQMALPPPAPPDLPRLQAAAARYGIDILGPLPG